MDNIELGVDNIELGVDNIELGVRIIYISQLLYLVEQQAASSISQITHSDVRLG